MSNEKKFFINEYYFLNTFKYYFTNNTEYNYKTNFFLHNYLKNKMYCIFYLTVLICIIVIL